MNVPISEYQNFQKKVPAGDNRERFVCDKCSWIHYENPRIVTAAFCIQDDLVLLCRRAIRPRYGYWTLPGGFMEIGETAEAACSRETREEAGAEIELTGLLSIYSIPRIGQVHLVYLATLTSPEITAGPESLELTMIPFEDVPLDELAFPVNRWALEDFLSLDGQPPAQPFTTRPDRMQERIPPMDVHPDYLSGFES